MFKKFNATLQSGKLYDVTYEADNIDLIKSHWSLSVNSVFY